LYGAGIFQQSLIPLSKLVLAISREAGFASELLWPLTQSGTFKAYDGPDLTPQTPVQFGFDVQSDYAILDGTYWRVLRQ